MANRMLSPTEAAALRRHTLLAKGWPTSECVARQLGLPGEPAQAAAALRASGRLLGVWSSERHTFVHPTFQFDADGRLLPEVASLLAVLPVAGDEGGWRRTFWLYGVREALGGECPADIFARDPARVLALARMEFGEEPLA